MVWTRISMFFFFQAEDGIRDLIVTGVQTCALPICQRPEVPRGANSQWANIPDRLVSVWGKRPVDDSRELPSIRPGAGLEEVIDALQLAVVLVGAIEQQRIERLAEEKGSGGCNPCLVEDPCALSHIGSR